MQLLFETSKQAFDEFKLAGKHKFYSVSHRINSYQTGDVGFMFYIKPQYEEVEFKIISKELFKDYEDKNEIYLFEVEVINARIATPLSTSC